MGKRFCILLGILVWGSTLRAQQPRTAADSLEYYDALFSELDDFLDSITAPRTMIMVNAGVSSSFYNYETASSFDLQGTRKWLLSPSVGYFHKKGPGIMASAMIVDDGRNMNAYQFLLTGSYDFLGNDAFATGINYTRFFTKDSLPFYTTPIQNELGAYFTYRNWWIKPSVSASYGWGSRSDVEEREEYITSLRLRPRGFTRVDTRETVSDFSLTASVRHDFFWLRPLGERSVLRLTPQLSFTSGTQKFGFNQTSSTYGTTRATNKNELYSSEENYLDNKLYFQPIAASAYVKTELSFGRFYVQPQLAFNYYFPATDKNLTANFIFNTGYIFSR